MSILSRLFGGGQKAASRAEAEPEIYKEYRIFAEPQPDPAGYRIAARIEKEVGGETRTHRLVRADTLQSAEEAAAFSVRKAKQVIDEQGDRIFG